MARQESDREDLMREATALVRRVELDYAGLADGDTVIAGFRRDGRLALYFGPDTVYQFDESRLLRRAYVGGLLYRTQGVTLARLTRHRTDVETHLIRHDLNPRELAEFRATAKRHLAAFQKAIVEGEIQIVAEIPDDGDILDALDTALAEILDRDLPLAALIPGKR